MNQQAETKSDRGVRQRLAVALVAFVVVAGAAWSLLQWAAADVQLPRRSVGESPSVSSENSVRQPAGRASEQRTVASMPAPPSERVFGVYSVPSAAGSVRGSVVSRSGEGLVGTAVVLRVVRFPAEAATVHATAVTDAEGTFCMEGVAPGAYDITAEAPGCLACARIVEESVVPADVTEFFVSRRPTGTLVEACEGVDGTPLPEAHVVVAQPGVAGQGGKRQAQTGADGSVSLPGLLEGKAVVTVAHQGRSREGTAQVVPGTTVALTMRLP